MAFAGSEASAKDLGSLCYFLVCYRNVEHVAFLLASLYREQDVFLIHCDRKAPAELNAFLHSLAHRFHNVHVMASQDYSWAGFSHVRISLQAIATALTVPEPWSHFIFLSEQHLPLKSPADLSAHLARRKTMVAMRPATEMVGHERLDIENRFALEYRELPGVGCFAIALAERDDDFIRHVYHGSNWIVLHRDHCCGLLEAERAGKFEPFRFAVHAEETAIQSIIAPWKDEIESIDPTLVAFPNLTDNHALVMTDALFDSAVADCRLFIRKRQAVLSAAVRAAIVANHFRDDVYSLHSAGQTTAATRFAAADARVKMFNRWFARKAREPVDVARVDPRDHEYVPQIHLILTTRSMRPGLSVRVLSENLTDFKLCLVQEVPFDGTFTLPYRDDAYLYSTIRSKLFGLFGYRDILPIAIAGSGFVSLKATEAVDDVATVAMAFLIEGAALPS